jgi:hypothetical protein
MHRRQAGGLRRHADTPRRPYASRAQGDRSRWHLPIRCMQPHKKRLRASALAQAAVMFPPSSIATCGLKERSTGDERACGASQEPPGARTVASIVLLDPSQDCQTAAATPFPARATSTPRASRSGAESAAGASHPEPGIRTAARAIQESVDIWRQTATAIPVSFVAILGTRVSSPPGWIVTGSGPCQARADPVPRARAASSAAVDPPASR